VAVGARRFAPVRASPPSGPAAQRFLRYLTIQHGDFVKIYGGGGGGGRSFDAVVTCFFVDTARDAATLRAFVATIGRVLRPGGVWVNLGPVTWHGAGDDDGGHGGRLAVPVSGGGGAGGAASAAGPRPGSSVQLAYDELLAFIALQRVAAAGKAREGSGGSFSRRFRFVEREAPPAATSPYVSDDQNALAVLGYRSPLFVARLVAEEEGD